MAVKIRNFAHQNMVIGTPYSLNVRITGGPDDVRVDGLPDKLYYHWNPSRNRVQIRGTPDKLVFDQQMIITADDQIRRQTYSVIPILPAFDQEITDTVIKGIPFTLPVAVSNVPTKVSIEGPYIGLRFTPTPQGFNLYGTIPEDANFTKDRFVFDVAVSNYAGVVNGTITLTTTHLGGVKFYILDGDGSVENTKIKVYPSIAASSTLSQTITKEKEFSLPSIPSSTARYVAVANDGTNLYLLHSKGPSSNADDLDDQIVVVSSDTQDGQTAGIIRRFSITRTSNYFQHHLDDLFYQEGKLYILTSHTTSNSYQSYFVLEDIEGSDPTRIINLNARGGGISVTQGRLTAVLYERASPNQGNYFRIYPPSYVDGLTLIAESYDVYTTHGVIRENFQINTNDISVTSLNNFAYILSSTLPGVISTVEIPTPVNRAERRNEIILSPVLSQPQGITHL
ncbi:MAG: hypothetical protein F4039_04760 [Gammaproteobacteria bacterium]|nr:hypothetical protein [Gammaproteobacteria bacterium]MYK43381.1 hypothetical protein [Gammaproteobacteria bacterium]